MDSPGNFAINSMRSEGSGVEFYNQNGRALSQDERVQIAKRRGICVHCGVRTHEKARLKLVRTAVTDEQVYQGTCIRCNPEAVPPDVREAYFARQPQQPPPIARVSPRSTSKYSKSVSRRMIHSSSGSSNPSLAGRGADSGLSTPTQSISSSVQQHLRGVNLNPPLTDGSISKHASSRRLHGLLGNHSGGGGGGAGAGPATPSSSTTSSSGRRSKPTLSHNQLLNWQGDSSGSLRTRVRSLSNQDSNAFSASFDDASLGTLQDRAKALLDTRADPEARKRVLKRLRELAYPEGGGPVVDLLQDLIEREPTPETCAVLWRISDDSGIQHSSELLAVATSLVHALRRCRHQVTVWSLGAWYSLSAQHKLAMAQAGGIEVLLEILENQGNSNATIFLWTCRCLYQFLSQKQEESDDDDSSNTNNSPEDSAEAQRNAATMEESGGIRILVNAMTQHNAGESVAQYWAVKVCSRLFSSRTNSSRNRVRTQLREYGFLSHGVKILRARSTCCTLFAWTSEIMTRVLLEEDAGYEEVAECIPSLVRLMNEGDDEEEEDITRKSACRLLVVLCNGNEETLQALHDADAFKAIMTHQQDSAGHWALCKLVSHDPGAVDSESAEGVLANMMEIVETTTDENDADSKETMLMACAFLAIVASQVILKSAMVSKIVRRALDTYGDEPPVLEQVTNALLHLYQRNPQDAHTIHDWLGSDLLLQLCEKASGPTKWKVFYMCGVLASGSSSVARSLASAGFLEAIAEFWTEVKPQESRTQDMLLDLVTVLASTDQSVDVPASLVTCISDMVQPPQANESTVRRCCIALRNLVLVASSSHGFQTAWACTLLENSATPAAASVEVCRFLWAFASKFPDACALEAAGAFHSMIGLLQRYSDEGNPYHAGVLESAAQAFSAVTAVLPSRVMLTLDNYHIDAIIASVYKIIENDEVRTDGLAAFLLVLNDFCVMAPDAMLYAGVIVVLIDIMAERERCALVQERGCRILANLSSSEDLQVVLSIVQTEGVDVLAEAMAIFPQNMKIQSEACRAFVHLSSDDESRGLILAHGGIQHVTHALGVLEPSEPLLLHALKAAGRLAFLGSHPNGQVNESLLVDTGIIGIAIKILQRFPSSADIQESSLELLMNTAQYGPGIRHLIADSQGIEDILVVLQDYVGTPTVLKSALATLTQIVAHGENVTLFDSSAVQTIISAMLASIENEQVQIHGCELLFALGESQQTFILQAGGKDTIGHSMRAHYSSRSVQKAACRALSKLTSPQRQTSEIVATEPDVLGLASALRRFPGSEDIQENGCSVLRNLLWWERNVSVIQSCRDQLRDQLERASALYPRKCGDLARSILSSIL